MLGRLGNRLKLLTGGARDRPERQRTLRSTIEWSYGLLEGGEKVLFARLSVFAGGRTLEAIEAVCDAEGDLPVDVLDGLASLVDESLLKQEEGVGGEPRFVMLETIHEFAREKLQESEEAEDAKEASRRVLSGPGRGGRTASGGSRSSQCGWNGSRRSTTTSGLRSPGRSGRERTPSWRCGCARRSESSGTGRDTSAKGSGGSRRRLRSPVQHLGQRVQRRCIGFPGSH